MRLPKRATATALCVALMLPTTACSLVAVKRLPGEHQRGDRPECTSSYAFPAIDGVGAILFGASAVTLLTAAEDDNTFKTIAWTSLVATLGLIVSATYGSRQILRCRRAEAEAAIAAPVSAEPETPGVTGARCTSDKDCRGDLICDQTMHTCIPLEGEAPDDLEGAREP